jgi:hypothetical protein
MLGATAYAVVPGLDLIHFQMQFFFNLPKEDRVRLIIMPSTTGPGTHAQWSVVSGPRLVIRGNLLIDSRKIIPPRARQRSTGRLHKSWQLGILASIHESQDWP